MSNQSKNVPAVTKAASLAGRAIARLEDAAAKAMREADGNRSLKLLSTPSELHAVIRCGKTTIQIEGDSFAVDLGGEEK